MAILDTGVDPYHPDLASKLLAGWNSASSNTDTTDINGHGTKVAGAAAAITDNSIGVAGVAGAARILPVRVTNSSDGSASTSAIANGLTWAANHGAHVANISYGVTGTSTVTSAAKYFMDKSGLTVVSAGNSGNG